MERWCVERMTVEVEYNGMSVSYNYKIRYKTSRSVT